MTLIFSFHPFGIWHQKQVEKTKSLFQSWIYKGNFFIQSQDTFYFLGNCYAEKNFKKIEPKISVSQIRKIFIEDESCLPKGMHLQKKIVRSSGKNASIRFVSNPKSQFSKFYEEQTNAKIQVKQNQNPIFPIWLKSSKTAQGFVRYNGDKKKLTHLISALREFEQEHRTKKTEQSGFLVLDFPAWTKEKPEDWKKFQKLLGISSYWKIMSVEELLASPLHHTHRDSEFSLH
jgi:hypothetical protein